MPRKSRIDAPGALHESHCLESLIESHHENTGRKAEIAVADSKYGTVENYLACHDQGVKNPGPKDQVFQGKIKAHFASLEDSQRGSGRQKEIFPKEAFTYVCVVSLAVVPRST